MPWCSRYPPYEFDAATPGTLVARSAFFGQHGYVPDVQNLKSNTNMRATFLAGGPRIEEGKAKDIRSIDLAPTMAFLLGIPAPQNSQGVVRRDFIRDSGDYTPISIVGLNDFHGQLDQTTGTIDNLTETARRRAAARHDVRRGGGRAARPDAAAGGGRQRRRLTAELGAAGGPADDRRGERVGARRHELRQPRVRLRRAADPRAGGAGAVPVAVGEHRRRRARAGARLDPAVDRAQGPRDQGRRDRRHRAHHARARERGQHRGADVPRRGARGSRPSRRG